MVELKKYGIAMIEELSKEAEYFLKFFKKEDGKDIVNLYIDSHNFLFQENEIEIQRINIEAIIKYKLDVEAIEFACRVKNKDNLLTKKIHIMIYILESQKQNNHMFLNYENGFLKGFSLLAFFTIRSIYSLVKGKYLIWRYKLV